MTLYIPESVLVWMSMVVCVCDYIVLVVCVCVCVCVCVTCTRVYTGCRLYLLFVFSAVFIRVVVFVQFSMHGGICRNKA